MNRLFILFLTLGLFPVANPLMAQEISLPVSNPQAFIDGFSPLSVNYGISVPIPLMKEADIAPCVLAWAGFNTTRLQFNNNMIFEDRAGELVFYPDPDPAHEYPDRLFRKGKSYLQGNYVGLHVEGGVLFYKILYITTGPTAMFLVGTTHKRKWFENGEKMKEKVKGRDLFMLNKNLFGWKVTLGSEGGGEFFYEYRFTNLFQEVWGVDYQPHTIGYSVAF